MRFSSAILITWSICILFVAPHSNYHARNGNELFARFRPGEPFEEYNPETDGYTPGHEPETPPTQRQPEEMTEQAIEDSLPPEDINIDTIWLRTINNDPARGTSAIVEPSENGKPVRAVIGYHDMPIAWKSGRKFGDDSRDQEFSFPISDNEERSMERQNSLEESGDRAAVQRSNDLWNTLVTSSPNGQPLEKLMHDFLIGRALDLAKQKGVPLVVVLPGKPKGSVYTTIFRILRRLAPPKPSNVPPNEYVQPKYTDSQKTVATGRRKKQATTIGQWRSERVLLGRDDYPPSNLGKRASSVLSQISQDSESTSNSKSPANQTDLSELYWNGLQAVRSNISRTIFPILRDMVNGSNSSVVYNAAWSIWTDLTLENQYVSGPFMNGLHQLDSLEDQYAKDNNLSTTDPTYLNVLAMNAVLIDLYQTAWNRSVAAINATGLLSLRNRVAGVLIQKNSTLVNIALSDYDDKFFVTYNS